MYNTDSPICCKEDDILGRVSFSKHLAHAISDYKTEDSVCIGLLGKWGCGKTSVINLMVAEIDDKNKKENEADIIVCRFEPWNFTGTDQLLQQFFVMLSSAFEKKSGKAFKAISKKLAQYGESLIDLASLFSCFPAALGTAGKAFFKTLTGNKESGNKDILKQKQEVTTMLLELKHKVLIIIDDIDRLSNDQIRAVFQLVTSVAKLPNLMYLLSFDRDVVIKALEEVQKGDGSSYLEKVIQIPISLPEITNQQLNNILLTKLQHVIDLTTADCYHEDRWHTHFATCVDPFVHGIRDVNRLCNVLLFKLGTIGSDVDFLDMVCLTLIEINYPQVFTWCNNHKMILTGENDFSFNQTPEDKSKYENEIRALLPDSSDLKTAPLLVTALAILFPHFAEKIRSTLYAPDYQRMRRYNQIAIAEKFDRYFQMNPNDIFLSKGLIDDLLYDATEDALVEDLLKYDQKGILPELVSEIRSRVHSINNERAHVWINVLFRISSECYSTDRTLLFSSGTWLQVILRDLMEHSYSEEERYQYVHDTLHSADWSVLKSIATFMNFTELAYGRFTDDGESHDYLKLISMDHLEKIERQFCEYVEANIDSFDILSADPGQLVFRLMLKIDKAWVDHYMSDIHQNDIKALKYLRCYITHGHHSSIGYCYSLPHTFDDMYITETQVRKYAQKLLSNPNGLSALPDDVKTAIAVLEIIPENRNFSNEYASVARVEDMIKSWEVR